jgi:hypothetical protein
MRGYRFVLLALVAMLTVPPTVAAGAAEIRQPREPRMSLSASKTRSVKRSATSRRKAEGMVAGALSREVESLRPSRDDRSSRSSVTERARPRRRPAPRGTVAQRVAAAWPGDDRDALRVVGCESGFEQGARSGSGRYSGLFQFDQRTWQAVGGTGPPAEASVEEQTRRAWRLYQQRGWAPWPSCGRG